MRRLPGVLVPSADAAVLPGEPRWATLRLAAVTGLVAGVASFAVHDALPGPWDRLGGSAGLWCALTWWAGQRVRPPSLRWGALVGLITQWCLLVGFYGALVVLAGRGDDPWRVLSWTALALLAGPVFGVLGALRWSRGSLSWASSAFVGAAVVLEQVLTVVPGLVRGLRVLPPGVENIGPSGGDLWWAGAAAALGLVVAAACAPPGRWSRAVALAVVVVVLGATAVAALAARETGLL